MQSCRGLFLCQVGIFDTLMRKEPSAMRAGKESVDSYSGKVEVSSCEGKLIVGYCKRCLENMSAQAECWPQN